MEIKLEIKNIGDSSEYPKTEARIVSFFKITNFMPHIGDSIACDDNDDCDLTVIERWITNRNTIILWVTEDMVQVPFLNRTGDQIMLERTGRPIVRTPTYLFLG